MPNFHSLSSKTKPKLPWYRGLWWTIWLTILATIALYTAGTALYQRYVITPAIQAERNAIQEEREAFARDFQKFLQEQTTQYHLQLENWRTNTEPGTPPPLFNYQDKIRQFRKSQGYNHASRRTNKEKTPINLWVWLSLMALAMGVATYPIARRLTRRLEKLQQGVETFGTGNLGSRVRVEGYDEVALLAQSFNASAEQIEHLLQQHKHLLSHVSHELRTPLARLRMSTELAALQVPDVAQDLRTDIRELDELVGEILLASRLNAVPDLLKMSSFDAFALAAEEAARTRTELEGCSIEMCADETLVRRALRNLLTNAEKYASESQSVLTVYREKGKDHVPEMVCFRVEDHGLGIPKAESQHIFEPFYRGPSSASLTHGVGLGLSLVAQIAKRHDGSVKYLTPETGKGSIFELRIPIRPTTSKNQ